MSFPVDFQLGGFTVHPHVLFDLLAYAIGFQTYLLLRRWRKNEPVEPEAFLWILVGCVVGALVGSKVLAWLESWPTYWNHRGDWRAWASGKTIVGGLVGGWAGIELVKWILGVRSRTGDGYVIPLCIGMAIGRVGCFLTGLDDHTHGVATSLPWGIDFGDQVRRHPTQLYESAWLILIALLAMRRGVGWRGTGGGAMFRVFIGTYMAFRFGVEFIKPTWKGYLGLSAIQWAAMITVAIVLAQVVRVAEPRVQKGTA